MHLYQLVQYAPTVPVSPMPWENGWTHNSNQSYKHKNILQKLIRPQARRIDPLTLPSNERIFTYDAISMYTNIDTDDCILPPPPPSNNQNKIPTLSPQGTVDALTIIMKNNRMKFGNLHAKQHKGITMGMSPAPMIANLYIAIYEDQHIFNNNTPPQIKFFADSSMMALKYG